MSADLYHVIVYAPVPAAEAVRSAIGDAGGGVIGNYTHCSFSITGTGRFLGNNESSPAVGEPGSLTEVAEERIEFVTTESSLSAILDAVKKIHPYEEPAIHVLPMLDYTTFLSHEN